MNRKKDLSSELKKGTTLAKELIEHLGNMNAAGLEIPIDDYIVSIRNVNSPSMSEIIEALRAPTHVANDYNCEDWPIGQGCRGCDGDEIRNKMIKMIKTIM